MVINTNIEAQRTADNLLNSQRTLQKSLARLSSGSKIISPADNAAGLAVSSRLTSQLRRMDAVMNNLSAAMSYVQTQESYLKTIGDALVRMNELSMAAQDDTKNAEDKKLYQKEMDQLQEFAFQSKDKKFNGTALFGDATTNKITVTIDEDSKTMDIAGIHLGDTTSKLDAVISAAPLDISGTSADPKDISGKISLANAKIQEYRAGIGAVQARMNYITTQMTEIKLSLSAAKSRITDVDMAAETTQYAKQQILVQSGTQMLREANQLPQTALELLR